MDTLNRIDSSDRADATVPLQFIKQFEHESLRWPPHLDHHEIVRRLVAIRESAPSYRNGLAELALLFEDVEFLPPFRIANRVLAALAWSNDHPRYGFLAEQLQIVALNLKNLARD